jgi:hypothetical protein
MMTMSGSPPSSPSRIPAAVAAGALVGLAIVAAAAPARAQTTALISTDFTLAVAHVDSAGNFSALSDVALASFFSAARCACPTSFGVGVALTSDGAAKLASTDVLDATVMIGTDCDVVTATTCPSIGTSMTLSSSATSSSETLMTADVFSRLAANASCTALPATASRLWVIVRLNGTRITSQPSVPISLGGTPSAAPLGVAATTADSGLLVSWKASTTLDTIQGYQILCSPGPTTPSTAAYDTCTASAPTGGTGPFATITASMICSDLIAVTETSTRVKGLHNGTAYQVAVISIGNDGTASTPSAVAEGTPGPTLGFDDVYKNAGGSGLAGGCSVAGRGAGAGGRARGSDIGTMLASALLAVALLATRSRRRRRRHQDRHDPGRRRHPTLASGAVLLPLLPLLLAARPADARVDPDPAPNPMTLAFGNDPPVSNESPRNWNLELRFGPYYPNVDSEFADRADPARPFEQVFSTKKHLLFGVELDRQISHRGGTWAIGLGLSHYKATAAALASDQVTRTGDQTSLTIYPLSLQAVYRADILRQRFGSPVIPYAKLGLDYALWSISDTAKSTSTSGQTAGWNAAAGVSLDLSILDPEGVHTLDMETGINQIAIFFEVTHAALDGFGSSSVLRVGDTTWLGGLMFEM